VSSNKRPNKEKNVYEREERLIEAAKRQAAEATASLPPTGKGASDPSAILAFRQAITECESAKSMISSVYQTLRCPVPADRADVGQRRKELLQRAWNALLLAQQEQDFLVNDIYRLQSETNRANKRL
jgi:hypothetical protein